MMAKLPDGILKTVKDIEDAVRLAKGWGLVDPADGGKTKASNNSEVLKARNKAIYEKFLELQNVGLTNGIGPKKARAAAIKQLELDGQDPTVEADPLSIQQLRKIIRQFENT